MVAAPNGAAIEPSISIFDFLPAQVKQQIGKSAWSFRESMRHCGLGKGSRRFRSNAQAVC
jgi:hypothetical protein